VSGTSHNKAYTPTYTAQNFTVGNRGPSEMFYLGGIQLMIGSSNNPSNLNISIVGTDSAGLPDLGDVLAFNDTTSGIPGGGGNDYVNFTFPGTLSLRADKVYAIVLAATGSGTDTYDWFKNDSGADYEGGSAMTSSDKGVSWTGQTSSDQVFEVWGTKANLGVFLDFPTNNSLLSQAPLHFNSTADTEEMSFVNATLYLWNAESGAVANDTVTTAITGNTTNSTNLTMTSLDNGEYYVNVLYCAVNGTGTLCDYDSSNNTLVFGISDLNQTEQAHVYETATSTYNVTFNVTSGTPSGLLYVGSSSYTGEATNIEGNFWRLNQTLDVPTTTGDQNVFWQITTGTFHYNISTQTQNINATNFTLCDVSEVNLNTTYINFTFNDEETQTAMKAEIDSSTWEFWLGGGATTKTETFLNNSNNTNYGFCFDPDTETAKLDLTLKYSNSTTHPQRTYSLDNQELTSATTQQTLYLLGTADGIYSTIQVVEDSGTGVQDVYVTIERQVNNVWTNVGASFTGSDGGATFWVNPNFQHRVTASKTGYSTSQVTITPSQSLYTLTLSKGAANATHTSDVEGLIWEVLPSSGVIKPKSTNFNATVTSSESNLDNCKFELLNVSDTSQVLASGTSITNVTYCQVSFDYITVNDVNLFGRLSVDTTATDGFVILDTDWKWVVIDVNATSDSSSIKSLFEELTTLEEFGEGNQAVFSRMVLFFLVTTILIGVFTFFSGFEISSPGISVGLVWFVVLFASFGSFLTFDSGSDNVSSVMEKFGFFFILTLFVCGYMLNVIRREGE
jgi:hypothetical protein